MLACRLILVGLSLCLLSAGAFAQALEVTVKEVDGDVEVRFPDRLDWETAVAGMKLQEGTEVRTGPFSHTTLQFEDTSVTIVDSFSSIAIDKFLQTQAGVITRLSLKVGTIISNVKPDEKRPNDYKVMTPTLIASVRGTEIKQIIAGQLFRDGIKMGPRGKLEVTDQMGGVRLVSKEESTDSKLTRSGDLFTRDSVVHFTPLGSTDAEVRDAVSNFTKLASLISDLAQNLTLPSPSDIARGIGDAQPSTQSTQSAQSTQSSQIFSDNFSGGLTSWTNSSNAFTTSTFGTLTSPDGSPFAVIHTGLGSLADSGLLSKQMDIASSQDTNFNFKYNFISTEYPRFVGSAFNDYFKAEIHTPDGVTHVLAQETVNSSTFTPVSGLPTAVMDFSTGGQTGWKTVEKTVATPSGTTVLHFHVQDVGDSVRDSAALIDNVEVKHP